MTWQYAVLIPANIAITVTEICVVFLSFYKKVPGRYIKLGNIHLTSMFWPVCYLLSSNHTMLYRPEKLITSLKNSEVTASVIK